MAHRIFRDVHGREWDAWEVVPTAVERRIARENRQRKAATIERRNRQESRVLVPDELQRGWLAFQSGSERKRLAPIPEHWSEMNDEELGRLLERADRRAKARRLIE